MKIDLEGKVALVTGGTRGIGEAISLQLASAGATVAVNYLRNVSVAKAFGEKVRRKKLSCFMVPGDVSDFLEADHIIHRIIEKVGKLDIVINNAGIWEPSPMDNPRIEKSWDRVIQSNLKSAMNITTHALPYLKKSKEGRIINIASTAGQRGEANYSAYAASKGAIISATKSWAVEFAINHILVNCVAPGWVWTDMAAPALKKPGVRKQVLKSIPLGKVAKPEEIASMVTFLASSHASHITGEIININGGSVLCG